jgi:hypothetical protein
VILASAGILRYGLNWPHEDAPRQHHADRPQRHRLVLDAWVVIDGDRSRDSAEVNVRVRDILLRTVGHIRRTLEGDPAKSVTERTFAVMQRGGWVTPPIPPQ